MTQTNTSQEAASGLPIHSFSRCHDGIRTQLQSLARLPQQISETARGCNGTTGLVNVQERRV